MKRFLFFPVFLGAMLSVLLTEFLMGSVAQAAIIASGDIDPDDPNTWTSLHHSYIGYASTGILTITNGSSVTNYNGYIGYQSGARGMVTVEGQGSTWNNGSLLVGEYGTGTLAITNGGSVTDSGTTYIGNFSGSNGMLTVDGVGSTLNSRSSFIVGNYGVGTLDIINGGSVAESASAYIGYQSGSNGKVTVDGERSIWANNHNLYVGFEGTGMLAVTNGSSVTSGTGYIGTRGDSSGAVNVDGDDSSWTNSGTVYVGQGGNGTLSITNGGSVVDSTAYIAYATNSSGIVYVDGEGSSWTNNYLYVGRNGTGTLTITNGGSVTDDFAVIAYDFNSKGMVLVDGEGSSWINDSYIHVGHHQSSPGLLSVTSGGLVNASTVAISMNSTVTVDVNSDFKVGTAENSWGGSIVNYGTVQLVAGAGADSGIYTPISYGTMSGSGTVQALGGAWDDGAHTITVSDAVTASGAGGATTSLDLAENQRMLITDTATGVSVGVSFLGTDISTEISLTATTINGDDLFSLESLIAETGASILSAWEFSTDGYTVSSDTPVYLSLYADSATDLLDLGIWHLVNGEWTAHDANGLAFDGTFASFVATGFSGYAVTSTSSVPVPSTMLLFGSALLCLVSQRRRMGIVA